MRLNVRVAMPSEVQKKLFIIATSNCKNIDAEANGAKKITTRFIKDKITSLLGVKLQGVVYKEDGLILQVDNKYKFEVIKKQEKRISNYLTGITKNIRGDSDV